MEDDLMQPSGDEAARQGTDVTATIILKKTQ
jgi:hypothetical protein